MTKLNILRCADYPTVSYSEPAVITKVHTNKKRQANENRDVVTEVKAGGTGLMAKEKEPRLVGLFWKLRRKKHSHRTMMVKLLELSMVTNSHTCHWFATTALELPEGTVCKHLGFNFVKYIFYF